MSWYRWQAENELRSDPDYQALSREGSGEWTPGDLLWLGMARLWPDDMPRRGGGGDPAEHPQHKMKIERAHTYIKKWIEEWSVRSLVEAITSVEVDEFLEAIR